MIPLVGFKKELDLQTELVHRVAKEVQAEKKVRLSYLVGTMIEVPRGALTAEFLSFGTNDLTQASKSFRRGADNRRRVARAPHRHADSGSFLPPHAEWEFCKTNPFVSIEQTGVGQLIKIAVDGGGEPFNGGTARRRRRRCRRVRERGRAQPHRPGCPGDVPT